MIEVSVRKSIDLSAEEFREISRLFENVFGKPRSVETFHKQYQENPFGYAWLSILLDDGRIVGLNSYVPSYYIGRGQRLVFANSVDSMVDSPYRDFFNFHDMVKKAYKTMGENGIDFVYGYPNDTSFPVLIKGKLMKSIGKMNTYCLPYRIGGIKPRLKLFNPLSMAFSRLYSAVMSIGASREVCHFQFEKELESYNSPRYNRGDGDYGHADLGNGHLHYKIVNHDGVRTAFIIDIDLKSSYNFNKAVRFLLKNHSQDFDLILYPGYLPFNNTGLIKLPRKFEPKNFNFCGKILNKSHMDDTIWEIENWDTNLSNYDLI